MNIHKIKKIIGENKKLLEQAYSVKTIGVFGSYAKGYAYKKSDVDVLVEFHKTPDMFRFLELEYFLGRLLHRKIDLVTRQALKPLIKNDILRETVYL